MENHFPSAQELIFPLQRTAVENRESVALLTRRLDQKIEDGSLRLDELNDQGLKGVLTKLTFLYGQWICNFQCPSYCYTKNLQSDSLTPKMAEKIMDIATIMGAKFTYWPGIGELTLLPDFWKLMQYQSTKKIPAIVFTNGSVFVDENLCQTTLGYSCTELFTAIKTMPNLYFYIKMWSTEESIARQMTGTKNKKEYPYVEYNGLRCPESFAKLHSLFGKRIGIQTMVTQKNYKDYIENILPFCMRHQVHLFAEPIILSGNAQNNRKTILETLTSEQTAHIEKTFASGGDYCKKRQFGEMILIGNKMTPGIAIPTRPEDSVLNAKGELLPLQQIYFNDYFREMRKKSDQLNGCLCREFWNEKRI